jgi:hypothetical protein
MCDYSLEMYASRPARASEVYVTSRFPSGSIGLAAPGDCTTAVCMTYGNRLLLENLPGDLQATFGVQAMEEVTFRRLEEGLHHDGVEFANGSKIPLHRLGTGVLVSLVEVEKREAEKPVLAEKEHAPAEALEPAE